MNVIRTSARDIRFENCILIVEFMQILTFARGHAIYLRKTFYMQNLYLVMRKDFVYVKSESYVFLLCDGKFFVRINEKFCPCLDC